MVEPFKIDNFVRQHGIAFPGVEPLTRAQCDAVAETLRQRLGVPASDDAVQLVSALDAAQHALPHVDAGDTQFDVLTVLPPSALAAKSVMVNWYRFDEIDRLDLKVLASFFSDLWYPAADDIDILDDAVSWVVSIRHDGVVKRVIF